MLIEEHAQRMFREYVDLAQRVHRLFQYLDENPENWDYDGEDYQLLEAQMLHMRDYMEILGKRLTLYFRELDYTL